MPPVFLFPGPLLRTKLISVVYFYKFNEDHPYGNFTLCLNSHSVAQKKKAIQILSSGVESGSAVVSSASVGMGIKDSCGRPPHPRLYQPSPGGKSDTDFGERWCRESNPVLLLPMPRFEWTNQGQLWPSTTPAFIQAIAEEKKGQRSHRHAGAGSRTQFCCFDMVLNIKLEQS
ncbi:hypothetical protein K438DRAFT_1789703 [Mycena galopus ATCC 62051]|nr:hypothetical protein K438DRAFT_1789703 [Mycena galopus ATCC 62051]